MKKLILLIGIIILSRQLNAQNSGLIVPPYFYDVSSQSLSPLPIASTASGNAYTNYLLDGYDGQVSQGSSNAIFDIDGNLKFFIVDGVVFDKNGENPAVLTGVDDNAGPWMDQEYWNAYGSAETVIVPNPGNCKQYYIISEHGHNATSYNFVDARPSIDLYDVETKQLTPMPSWYYLIGSPNPGYFSFNGSQIGQIFEKFGWGGFGVLNQKLNGNSYGVSVHNNHLSVLKIDQNGVAPHFYQELEINSWHNQNRSILEIYDVPGSEYVYVAYTMLTGDLSTNTKESNIVLIKMDNAMQVIYEYDVINIASYISEDEVYIPTVHGLEFSPNGQYLYFTHSLSEFFNEQFAYIDLSDNTVHPLSANGFDIQNSEIENSKLAGNDVFTLAYEGGLLKLNDPNNPGAGTLSLLSSFTNAANYSTYNSVNQTEARKLYTLPDQIDGMDYLESMTADKSCCIYYSGFSRDNYVAENTSTWYPSSNPLNNNSGNEAYIREELRIPAGKTVTIVDMTLHFAPEARVVIENGQGAVEGGRLVLRNSTLTNDTRCSEENMWLGVEVWGNANQGQPTNNFNTQGALYLEENSKIENAYIGALTSKRNDDGTFNNAFNGGYIVGINSTFYNNQRGVWFKPYMFGSANNLSSFTNCSFEWKGQLVDPSQFYHAQVQMEEVKGIAFEGCDFINFTPGAQNLGPVGQGDGYGIISMNSQFIVDAICGGLSPTCPNADHSTFQGLYYGINAQNSSNGLTFKVDRSNFTNCRYGIYVKGTQLERITRNNFYIRENTYQSAGLAIYNSTGYTIQENNFDLYNTQLSDNLANTYGIVVNNSGEADNDIYKNTFRNLKIGGQSEGVNGVSYCSNCISGGLTWTCNNFVSNIRLHDLTVTKGRINPEQGFDEGHTSAFEGMRRAARNTFSLTGEPYSLAHDIAQFGGQPMNYAYISQPNHFPNSTTTDVQPHATTWASYPITITQNACPSKISMNPIEDHTPIKLVKKQFDDEKGKLDVDQEILLTRIIDGENSASLQADLMAVSPFVNDEVLIAYIRSAATSGRIKELLVVNSHLSAPVLDEMINSTLPNGTKNQIIEAQDGVSVKKAGYNKISMLEREYTEMYNDLVGKVLLNEEGTQAIDLDELLTELSDERSKKQQIASLIVANNLDEAEARRQNLINEIGENEELELIRIHKDIRPTQATVVALENEPTLASEVDYLKQNASEEHVSKRAEVLLALRDGVDDVPEFFPLVNSSAMMLFSNEEEVSKVSTLTVVNMYPNPSNGLVNFDYPNNAEGTMLIEIIDLSGKVLFTTALDSTNGERVDLSHLNKGTYLAHITIGTEVYEVQLLQLK